MFTFVPLIPDNSPPPAVCGFGSSDASNHSVVLADFSEGTQEFFTPDAFYQAQVFVRRYPVCNSKQRFDRWSMLQYYSFLSRWSWKSKGIHNTRIDKICRQFNDSVAPVLSQNQTNELRRNLILYIIFQSQQERVH